MKHRLAGADDEKQAEVRDHHLLEHRGRSLPGGGSRVAGLRHRRLTYQEALSNAEVVIEEWIETARELGRVIPEPRGRLLYA